MNQCRRILLAVALLSYLLGPLANRSFCWWDQSATKYAHTYRAIGEISLRAVWKETICREPQLVALLVIPVGDYELSMGGPAVVIPESLQGIGLYPSGLYAKGRKIPGSDQGRIWLLRTTTQDVVPLEPGELDSGGPLTLATFKRLEHTELWKKFLKPVADEEGQAFLRLHQP